MTNDAKTQAPRISRRAILGATAGMLVAGSLRHGTAQESTPDSTPELVPIESTTVGELPTSGALRPGPVGQQSPLLRAVNPTDPVHIVIDKAGINADIVTMGIVNGVMENPPGPWVVAWYRQTATLGEPGNVVLSGHVDFWDVGPSVFFNLRELVEGDIITLAGENDSTWEYAVEWSAVLGNEELTSGKLQELVGATDVPSVTLITCGGEFDYANGEYLSRMVVRGRLQQPEGTPASTPAS